MARRAGDAVVFVTLLQLETKMASIVQGYERPELHKFVGALAGQGAKKGIFITTSNFTKEALDYTPKNETKIVLIDGEQLLN
jgi:restriction endonuclease Mrr